MSLYLMVFTTFRSYHRYVYRTDVQQTKTNQSWLFVWTCRMRLIVCHPFSFYSSLARVRSSAITSPFLIVKQNTMYGRDAFWVVEGSGRNDLALHCAHGSVVRLFFLVLLVIGVSESSSSLLNGQVSRNFTTHWTVEDNWCVFLSIKSCKLFL